MALATLFNIPNFSDVDTQSHFSFANNDHHRQIASAVFRLYNIVLPVYLLDPMPMYSLGIWLQNHQDAHNAQNAVLGIAGNDLSDLDLSKPDQISSWIFLHAIEHRQAADKLQLR